MNEHTTIISLVIIIGFVIIVQIGIYASIMKRRMDETDYNLRKENERLANRNHDLNNKLYEKAMIICKLSGENKRLVTMCNELSDRDGGYNTVYIRYCGALYKITKQRTEDDHANPKTLEVEACIVEPAKEVNAE